MLSLFWLHFGEFSKKIIHILYADDVEKTCYKCWIVREVDKERFANKSQEASILILVTIDQCIDHDGDCDYDHIWL